MAETIKTVGELAGICGHDGSNWEKVLIDASKRLVVAVASAIAQESYGYQYDGTTWRKSNLLWGYNDRFAYYLVSTSTVGDFVVNMPAVPEGYVYVITYVSALQASGGAITIDVAANGSAGEYCGLVQFPSHSSGVIAPKEVNVPLKAGDYLSYIFRNIAAGKGVWTAAWGYKMKVNM